LRHMTSKVLLTVSIGLGLILGWSGGHKIEAAQTPLMKSFSDVGSDHWANDAIQQIVKQGVVDGYQDGTFHPENSLTREQFSKLLTLAMDAELPNVTESTFSDVANSKWSMPYIEAVKDYVSGIDAGILAFFQPEEVITREDVAVALVKALKINTDAISNPVSKIRQKFADFDRISSGLEPYIAAAIENKLLDGYEDGTFQPKSGLTRAAAATLLSRLMQSPHMPVMKDIQLSVNVADSVETPKVSISGKVDKLVKIYVNDEQTPNYNGTYQMDNALDEGEGTYQYEVKAVKPNGRYKSYIYKVGFTIPAPKLTVEAPQETDRQNVKLYGKLSDINDTQPALRINHKEVTVNAIGEWSYTLALDEGINNISIEAFNQFQKYTSVDKKIRFNVAPPELNIDSIEETVFFKALTVGGKVSDKNDSAPAVTLNGKKIENGSFQSTLSLVEGENQITFRAINKFGKVTEWSKKITYLIKPPKINVEGLSEYMVFDSASVTISIEDLYDKEPAIYVNEIYKGKGTVTTNLSFKEGENSVTIRAVSSSGKEERSTTKVVYTILPPSLSVDAIPETTSSKTITIKASASDVYDRKPDIYVNGGYVGESSISYTLNLIEGINTITFKATNDKSKTTTVTKTVTYTPPPPTLTVDELPLSTGVATIVLRASAQDVNDSYPRLFLNGKDVGSRSMEQTATLREGANVFEFKATNNLGKSTATVVKTITYVIPGPTLNVSNIPDTTTTANLSYTVSATDPSGGALQIYINDKVEGTSQVTKTSNLSPGANQISIYAKNSAGRVSSTYTKTVIYTPPTPALAP
jgi:hypothetical protein